MQLIFANTWSESKHFDWRRFELITMLEKKKRCEISTLIKMSHCVMPKAWTLCIAYWQQKAVGWANFSFWEYILKQLLCRRTLLFQIQALLLLFQTLYYLNISYQWRGNHENCIYLRAFVSMQMKPNARECLYEKFEKLKFAIFLNHKGCTKLKNDVLRGQIPLNWSTRGEIEKFVTIQLTILKEYKHRSQKDQNKKKRSWSTFRMHKTLSLSFFLASKFSLRFRWITVTIY